MISFIKSRTGKLALSGVIIFLVLALSFPFFINRLINTSFVKDKISSFIYQKTGTKIESLNYSLTLFPQAGLKIKTFNFHPNDTISLLIDSLKVNIDLQQLFHGKLNIDQITIDHPKIELGNLNKASSVSPDFSLSMILGKLKTVFEFLPDHQEAVEIVFANGTSPYFERLDGSLILSKEKQELVLETFISRLTCRLSDFSNARLTDSLDLDLIEAEAVKSNVKLTSTGSIQGRISLIGPKLTSNKTVRLLDAPVIESSFYLSDTSIRLDIKPVQLNYPKGNVGVHLLTDTTRELSEIKFTGNAIQVTQARAMALTLFKDHVIPTTLFSILHAGVVPGVTVSFQSKTLKDLLDEDHLKLAGNIVNGSARIPKTDLTATHVDGDVTIDKGILTIDTTAGSVQGSQIETGKLTIDLLNHADYPFQGRFDLDVDLSMIPETLISLLPGTLLASELSLVKSVTGRAKTRLDLLSKTGSTSLDVNIQTADFSVQGNYDRIPGDIHLETINFQYAPDIIHLAHVNGMVHGFKIDDLDAIITLKDTPWLKIQSGAGDISLDTIMPWLMSFKKPKQMFSPVKGGKGHVTITSVDFSGPVLKPENWVYNVAGILRDVDLTTQPNLKQIENLFCDYRVSNDHVHLTKLQAKMSSLSWMAPFINQNHIDSILVPFDVQSGNLLINTNKSVLQADLKFISGPTVDIDLDGKTISFESVKRITLNDPKVSNAVLSFHHDSETPLFDFIGRLNTATLNKIIIPESYWAKKIDALTEGQAIILNMDKDLVLHITTHSINLNSMLSGSETVSNTVSSMDRLLPDKPIHFKADTLKIKTLTLTDIDSNLSFKKNHSYVRLKQAFLCGLKTSAYISIKDDIVYANIPFEADKKDNIQDLLTCLFQKNDFMDGQYSLTCDIQSASKKKEVMNKLGGTLRFHAENGRIYKLTLLSRILSVLNVTNIFKGNIPDITQKGFAYNTITIEADIKDSIIHLTKAIIDGQDMTLIFSGQIDPVNDKLDLVCLVAPFKTVDLIIEKIPIINTLLGGRLVSFPTKATGKLSDPTVIPLHPSAVGTGLVNMMSDILKTPVKLWDKINGEQNN